MDRLTYAYTGEALAADRLSYPPKVPVGWIVHLYQRDALGLRDDELATNVGRRLLERCRAVLMVSSSHARCPCCDVTFAVPWIGASPDARAACPGCGWSIGPDAFHASFEQEDLWGINARYAFETFVREYPLATSFAERMLLTDRLVHAVHKSGNTAARNLVEGNPREVLATLDRLASRR